MRTVEELENAGVSALTIEDTVMPIGFGSTEEMQFRLTVDPLISLEEGVGKMKAALAARKDPSLVIVGRTRALHLPTGGVLETIRRVKAYEKAGVDAINLSGLGSLEQLEAIHAETKLPLMCGTWLRISDRRSADKQFLAANGLRMEQPGHLSLFAAMKAEYDVLKALHDGTAPDDLNPGLATPELQGRVLRKAQVNEWIKNFLGG
jgi:carboxyvinyl-carboxyphosphonate phosphorylmutase